MEVDNSSEKDNTNLYTIDQDYKLALLIYLLIVKKSKSIKLDDTNAIFKYIDNNVDDYKVELYTPLSLKDDIKVSVKRFCKMLIPTITYLKNKDEYTEKFITNTLFSAHLPHEDLDRFLIEADKIKNRIKTWKNFDEFFIHKKWPIYIKFYSNEYDDDEILGNIIAGLWFKHKRTEEFYEESLRELRGKVLSPINVLIKIKEFLQEIEDEVKLKDLEEKLNIQLSIININEVTENISKQIYTGQQIYNSESDKTIVTKSVESYQMNAMETNAEKENISDILHVKDIARENVIINDQNVRLNQVKSEKNNITYNKSQESRTEKYHPIEYAISDPYFVEKANIEDLINNATESKYWDYKFELNIHDNENKAEFIKDMVALANTALKYKKPTMLIIGVSNDKKKIQTIQLEDLSVYENLLNSYVYPQIDFNIRYIEIKGDNIAIFKILQNASIPFTITREMKGPYNKDLLSIGESWIRFGTNKKFLDHQEVMELTEKLK